jgi:hypothetical protein
VARQREQRILRDVWPLKKSPGHDAVRRICWQGALRTVSFEISPPAALKSRNQFASSARFPIFAHRNFKRIISLFLQTALSVG